MTQPAPAPATLRRNLGLPLLTLYGLGTIVGGGFYALVGEVAAHAGSLTPIAFLTAAAIAGLSALSFAELSARMPVSAGEAAYVREAFKIEWLSAAVGWAVLATGVVSAATLANAFAGFLGTLVELPSVAVITALVVGLGLVSAWGIGESVALAVVITVIEVGGLLVVLALAAPHPGGVQTETAAEVSRAMDVGAEGILLGAFVAFYSFVGLEDMVNLAEEVKRPERTLPLAILLSLGLTTILYIGVTVAVIGALPLEQLIASKAPLSDAVRGSSPWAAEALTIVGMLAGINGALVQVVMAARVGYGLAGRGQAPRAFANIHPKTRTPLEATGFATLIVLCLALWFPLLTLAKLTSFVLLCVYGIVNLSLFRLKTRGLPAAAGAPNYPRWIPLCGFVTCVAFLLFQLR